VVSQLGLHRPLHQGFSQLLQQPLLANQVLGPLVVRQQLVDQLFVDCHFAPLIIEETKRFTQKSEHPRTVEVC
jgi:hypothetical protein